MSLLANILIEAITTLNTESKSRLDYLKKSTVLSDKIELFNTIEYWQDTQYALHMFSSSDIENMRWDDSHVKDLFEECPYILKHTNAPSDNIDHNQIIILYGPIDVIDTFVANLQIIRRIQIKSLLKLDQLYSHTNFGEYIRNLGISYKQHYVVRPAGLAPGSAFINAYQYNIK